MCRLMCLVSLCFFALSTSGLAEEIKSAWVKPVKTGWQVTPLLNVGERVGKLGYRMVGVPDGLGAMDSGDGTLACKIG